MSKWSGFGSRTESALLVACLVGLALLTSCANEERMKKAKGHYQEGVALLEADRQQAFVSFQKAIQLDPHHREAHYSLGHLYAIQGKHQQAEEAFRQALKIDSDYSEAHNYLGQVLERQHRWPEAITEYRRALNNPLYATPDLAWFNLGRALAHERDFEGAVQAFEDAQLVSPPSVLPALLALELGRAYHQLGYEMKAKETLARVQTLDKGGQYAAEAGRLMDRLKP